MEEDRGYILAFTVIIIGGLLTLSVASTRTTLNELSVSEDSLAAVRALVAAESGVECALLFASQTVGGESYDGSFRLDEPGVTVSCPTLGSNPFDNRFDVGSPVAIEPPRCIPTAIGDTYAYPEFTIELDDGSCANVTVNARLDPIFEDVCRFNIASRGVDNCANPTVQRGRVDEIVSTS